MHHGIWHGPALALVLTCAQACAVTTNTEPKPSEQATPEQASVSKQPRAGATDVALLAASKELSTPVAVVALPASEARPCERMCGRLGDCLRDRDDINASYLELTCLDLCVNVDPESSVGQRFHDCGKQDACDPLLDCARRNWDATAEARVEFVAEILASPSYDACELVCGGLQSCMVHNQPLHLFHDRDEQFERDVAACVSNCDPQQSMMIELAACARVDTCEEQWACWQQVQGY